MKDFFNRSIFAFALLGFSALMAGCSIPVAPMPASELNLAESVGKSLDYLLNQAKAKRANPLWMQRLLPQSVIVTSIKDADNQQQTMAGLQARKAILEHIAKHHPEFKSVDANTSAPNLRLDATLTAVGAADSSRSRERFALNMQLIDLRNGEFYAGSRTIVADASLDGTPTGFYRDSPVTLNPPKSALPPKVTYVRNQTDSLVRLEMAEQAYEAGQYEEALRLYRAALIAPESNRMQAQIGEYVSLLKLGREDDAKQAFKRIVKLGLETQSLGVKLLFAPGKTEFWPDPEISKPYQFWLAEIAQQADAAPTCLLVVGHSSRTGEEAFNIKLSEERAKAILKLLEGSSPGLTGRTQGAGMGWAENLVGTGTDDLRDAIDRRVEFKVVSCQ